MQSSRGPLARPLEQPPGVLDVAGAEPPHGGAAGRGDHGGVVDGPVGARVDQERPLAGQGREHAVVGVGQGREGEDVLDPEQLADGRLDPPVGLGAGDPPGPAGMGPPAGQVGGHLGDHLEVEVEAEVVAGGEVDQPVAVDLDPPAVDLLDDRVAHGVLDHEPGDLGDQRGNGVARGESSNVAPVLDQGKRSSPDVSCRKVCRRLPGRRCRRQTVASSGSCVGRRPRPWCRARGRTDLEACRRPGWPARACRPGRSGPRAAAGRCCWRRSRRRRRGPAAGPCRRRLVDGHRHARPGRAWPRWSATPG